MLAKTIKYKEYFNSHISRTVCAIWLEFEIYVQFAFLSAIDQLHFTFHSTFVVDTGLARLPKSIMSKLGKIKHLIFYSLNQKMCILMLSDMIQVHFNTWYIHKRYQKQKQNKKIWPWNKSPQIFNIRGPNGPRLFSWKQGYGYLLFTLSWSLHETPISEFFSSSRPSSCLKLQIFGKFAF